MQGNTVEPGSYEEQNGARESLEWSEEPSGQEGPRMVMVAVPDYLLLVLTLVCCATAYCTFFSLSSSPGLQ